MWAIHPSCSLPFAQCHPTEDISHLGSSTERLYTKCPAFLIEISHKDVFASIDGQYVGLTGKAGGQCTPM